METKIEFIYQLYLAHPVVTTDSRNCPLGSIFFALKGNNFDGNAYAQAALEKGCSYAVVDDIHLKGIQDERIIWVNDVLSTLQDLATYHRKQWGGTIIQVTGTNGKTTTKELLAAVLSKKYNLHYTQGNLNNHIGVPLTLLALKPTHTLAVVETGANHPQEIAQLSSMVQADYGLITNVGKAHLEGFGSFEGVKKAKGELYDDLANRRKRIFLNDSDIELCEMATMRGFGKEIRESCIPYVEGALVDCNPYVEFRWRQDKSSDWHQVKTRLVGSYNVTNLCAAVTVGLTMGVSTTDINQALFSYSPNNHRSEWRKTAMNNLLIDAYNANLSSMSAALQSFAEMSVPNKMVILGEMRELGENSTNAHQQVIDMLETMHLSQVWLVGEEFTRTTHNYRIFSSVDDVIATLKQNPLQNKTILIKGSNGVHLPHILPYL